MINMIGGDAAAIPFETLQVDYNMDFSMRIGPELYIEQLIVGGIDRVCESG